MKRVRFFTTISIAAGIILFSSCNSKKDKKAEENNTTTPTETVTALTEVMIIKHQVADYAKWKPGYDAHDSARLANGLHNYVIARGVEDSNMVLIGMRMDDVDKAKAMAADPGLKDVMKKAGVIGTPEIDFTHSVMYDTTLMQQTLRLMIRYKVKDWDAWKKSFDSNKQIRMDAGLTDRIVAHTVGDDHNVTIVFAVADMDKANAFLNSKELKERREEAGVEGPVNIFFYRVVQRY